MIALAWLALRARWRRLLALVAFALLFVAAGATARLLTGGSEHVEIDRLFQIGGYPLVSVLLLLGWILGRFPMIAVLAMMAGVFSSDRRDGMARLYYVRPRAPALLYLARWTVFALAVFVLSAILMPGFDLLMLGEWAGPATLVLIVAYILVYGGLCALLSVWTRGDVWIAAFVAVFAMLWDALQRAGALPIAPGVRSFVGFLLPPQSALFQLESAFGQVQPIPWDAFAYCAGYGLILLALAGFSLSTREV